MELVMIQLILRTKKKGTGENYYFVQGRIS